MDGGHLERGREERRREEGGELLLAKLELGAVRRGLRSPGTIVLRLLCKSLSTNARNFTKRSREATGGMHQAWTNRPRPDEPLRSEDVLPSSSSSRPSSEEDSCERAPTAGASSRRRSVAARSLRRERRLPRVHHSFAPRTSNVQTMGTSVSSVTCSLGR